MVRIDKYFDVIYGVNLELIKCNIVDSTKGIPFVSRTSRNNGVDAYVEKIDSIKPNPGHTISVACGGSVLSCFYQEEPYYSGRDLFYLLPKIKLSIKEMLYYCYAIHSNSYKYNFGRQANRTLKEILIPAKHEIPRDILNKRVLQPITDDFIIKNIEFKKKSWKYFQIKKIFELKKCKCNNAAKLLTEGNDIYYIGAKKSENGIMLKVLRDENLVSKGNCIVFIGDGQGSIGYALYQDKDFIGSSTLTCGYNKKLNKYNGLFIVTILDLERYRYSFGRKYGKDKIATSKIKLPTKNGEPNFKFMENYIKSLPYSNNI
ncbi:MAG: restriction endonuclease subunit S [Bacteroidota bacterium]